MVTNEEQNIKEEKVESQTAPASSPKQQQAKAQIERKAEHLDNVVDAGEQIEKETKGKNPDWKGVKDLHAGKAPVDKILYEKENKEASSQKEVKTETPKAEVKTEKPKAEFKLDTGPKYRSSAVNDWVKECKNYKG